MAQERRINEAEFRFKVIDPEKEFGVLSFTATESISALFDVRLNLVSEDVAPFDEVINKAAVLTIFSEDDKGNRSYRYFHGIICEFGQAGTSGRFHIYRARIVPALWRLSLKQNCRIFQEEKITEIIEKILKEGEIESDRYNIPGKVKGNCEVKTYSVQYRETDMNFISRLLEEEGIFYFYEHAEDKHVWLLGDDPVSYKTISGNEEVLFSDAESMVPKEDFINVFALSCQVHSGKITLRDFNFEKSLVDLTAQDEKDPYKKLEVYDYPGEYLEEGVGKKLAKMRLEEATMFKEKAVGKSNCFRFAPGFTFKLKGHTTSALNKEYLIVENMHRGTQPQVLEERAAAGGTDYSNEFVCIDSSIVFRPVRRTPKPIVEGVQTAMVVGPKSEEIYTDKHGRVKVQFHWDREGKYDEKSSCWVRVAQSMAGRNWGSMYLPRIGHEVIVSFIEGDPDRPIITGSVYNSEAVPPYELPAEKTKSTYKSYSTPDGDGFNEIRFEDKKGEEQVFIHAENAHDLRVKGMSREFVGGERHSIVKKKYVEKIEEDKHLWVVGDHREYIESDAHRKIDGDKHELVEGNWMHQARGEAKLGSHQKMVIVSGMQISLKVGGNFIDISPSGITIKGTQVLINSGGSSASESAFSGNPPDEPLEADTAVTGQRVELRQQAPCAQAQAMQQASQSGAPFCEG
jgi:type VI secretion system secreted protein VgrG